MRRRKLKESRGKRITTLEKIYIFEVEQKIKMYICALKENPQHLMTGKPLCDNFIYTKRHSQNEIQENTDIISTAFRCQKNN